MGNIINTLIMGQNLDNDLKEYYKAISKVDATTRDYYDAIRIKMLGITAEGTISENNGAYMVGANISPYIRVYRTFSNGEAPQILSDICSFNPSLAQNDETEYEVTYVDSDGTTYTTTVTMPAGYLCCFEAGTPVLVSLEGDTKPIEEFKAGDNVVSYNIHTKEYYNALCTGPIINDFTVDIAEVTFENGVTLKMNAYHPIYCEDGFKSLTNHNNYPTLTVGDKAVCFNGEFSEIININRYQLDEPMTTYNLTVRNYDEYPDDDTDDTYIANGIVVHNAGCPIA